MQKGGTIKHVILSFLLSVSCFAQTRYTAITSGSFTTTSRGEYPALHANLREGNSTAFGQAGYFERWRGHYGLLLGESFIRTDAELSTEKKLIEHWPLQRYKFDALYVRSFDVRRVQPYAGAGAFMLITWGGSAPAHSHCIASGLDAGWGWAIPAGVSVPLTPRVMLRAGALADFGKASTYGDEAFRPGHYLMLEPQLGVSFKVGRTR